MEKEKQDKPIRSKHNFQFVKVAAERDFPFDKKEDVYIVVDGVVYYVPRCTRIIVASCRAHDVVFR